MTRFKLAGSLLIAAVMIHCGVAAAQNYPTKTVRIIVPFSAGGGTDIMARTLSQRLTENMGQTFIVDNRPGGNGLIGAELFRILCDFVRRLAIEHNRFR